MVPRRSTISVRRRVMLRADPWEVAVELDLTPLEMECIRCRARAPMRFYGMCAACRDELRAKFSGEGRAVEVAAYEPKPNVTPNAVALKDD